jgi:hypothetical protein
LGFNWPDFKGVELVLKIKKAIKPKNLKAIRVLPLIFAKKLFLG